MSNRLGIPADIEKKIRLRDKKCVYCHKIMIYPYIGSKHNDCATIEHFREEGPFYWKDDLKEEDLAICCGGCNSKRLKMKLLDWFKTDYCIKNYINEKTVAEPVKEYLQKIKNNLLIMQMSKSDYMLFLKHPAWLWLKKNDKNKLPPTSEDLQAIFDNGHLFEKYAEQLFPDSIRLGFSENDFSTYLDLPKRTTEALNNGAKSILQGRFEHDNITCIVDVLERASDGEFNLYEIKSSASVKPEHIDDLAFQYLVLNGSGLKIKKCRLST